MDETKIATQAAGNRPPGDSRQSPGPMALDQWRGLALILVLISHGLYFTERVHGIGRVGVNLFFFISGILVFRSLSRGRETGAWNLAASFWRKRLRRLYPALIAFILAMLPVTYLVQSIPNLPPGSDVGTYLRGIPVSLGYAGNYFKAGPMSMGHLWSLACEMQFYMLAPLIFLAGGTLTRQRNLVYGGLLLLFIGLGVSYPFVTKGQFDGSKYHFEFAVWPMMLGFCCEHGKRFFTGLPVRLVQWSIRIGVWVFVLGMVLMLSGRGMKPVVVGVGALLVGPCLLSYLYGLPFKGPLGRLLAWSGERTYSIYLWQQPFTICGFLPIAWHPVGAIVSMLVGAAWFHWFERPFLSSSPRKPVPNPLVTVPTPQ